LSQTGIRIETPSDIDAIREVNRVAFANHPFSRGTEPLIVDALRTDGALVISLVAVLDGELVGHVAFSPASVGDDSSGWYLLGPLAVLPPYRGRGIGSTLVEAGLGELTRLGALGCVLVGDPGYYGRFGFAAAPGLTYEGVPDSHVLIRASALDVRVGPIRAHVAFL